MAKLRPDHYAFLLQIESCVLIESPHKDPLAAIDHYLNDPDSKAINVHIAEVTSNRATTRRVQLKRPPTATIEPLDNLVQLDKYRRERNTSA